MPNTYVRAPGQRRRQDGPRTQRVPVARWIDPFPGMQGSTIEKMVMAELARRGIYFQHSTTSNTINWPKGVEEVLGSDPKKQKADILVPQYRIWIEVQGAYFHTLPGAPEHDALRFAIIEAAGWRPIFWWEDDIRTRLMELMDAVPEFYMIKKKKNSLAYLKKRGFKTSQGYKFFEGEAPDTLKGLRAALAGRAKPDQDFQIRRRVKRRKKYSNG